MTIPVTATISGQEVLASGSLVVPPQQTGFLNIGGMSFSLIFGRTVGKAVSGPTFSAHPNPGGAALNLMDFDNPLGTHIDITGLNLLGAPANLSLVIYSIGDNPARVIHYTFFRPGGMVTTGRGMFGRRGFGAAAS